MVAKKASQTSQVERRLPAVNSSESLFLRTVLTARSREFRDGGLSDLAGDLVQALEDIAGTAAGEEVHRLGQQDSQQYEDGGSADAAE